MGVERNMIKTPDYIVHGFRPEPNFFTLAKKHMIRKGSLAKADPPVRGKGSGRLCIPSLF